MPIRPSNHPRSLWQVVHRHQFDQVTMALAYLSRIPGNRASNVELAKALQVSPHGLRPTLEASGLFMVEIRGTARLSVWYSPAPLTDRPVVEPPPLVCIGGKTRDVPKLIVAPADGA